MAPVGPGSASGAAPLPPLPDLSAGGKDAGAAPGGALAGLVSQLTPIKQSVDTVTAEVKNLARLVPGSEQVCAQILAQVTSLLPMAVQQMTQPGPGPQAPGPVPAPGAPPAPGPVGPVGQ